MAGFLRALVAFLANRPLLLTSSKVLAGTYALILLLHAKSLPFAYHVLATLYVAPTRLTLEYGKKRTLIKPQQSTSTSFRVGFDDLDLNLHMNNGVYPKQCDYARLIFMTSLFGLQVLPLNPKFSLNFISGGTQFIFLKEIRLGQKYTITTRLLSFSEKWFYVQHVFSTVHPKTGKKVINCLAVTRLIFKETRGKLRGKTRVKVSPCQRHLHARAEGRFARARKRFGNYDILTPSTLRLRESQPRRSVGDVQQPPYAETGEPREWDEEVRILSKEEQDKLHRSCQIARDVLLLGKDLCKERMEEVPESPTSGISYSSSTSSKAQETRREIWRPPGKANIPDVFSKLKYDVDQIPNPPKSPVKKRHSRPWVPTTPYVSIPPPQDTKETIRSRFQATIKRTIPNVPLYTVDSKHSRYKDFQPIGTGVNGAVVKAVLRQSPGVTLALKTCQLMANTGINVAIQRELKIMSFNHPNLIALKEITLNNDLVWIGMELMKCSVFSILMKRAFPEPYAIYMAREVLEGLRFLHAKGYIHRDVKCENLLISPTGRIKLADFGLAARVDRLNDECLGTVKWMAPEVIEESTPYDSSIDMWSLGITLIEMMDRVPPHYLIKDDGEAMAAIVDAEDSPTFTYAQDVTRYMRGLVAWLLARNCTDRPAASDCLLELDSHIEKGLMRTCTSRQFLEFISAVLQHFEVATQLASLEAPVSSIKPDDIGQFLMVNVPESYRHYSIKLTSAQPSLTFGSDSSCDIVIAGLDSKHCRLFAEHRDTKEWAVYMEVVGQRGVSCDGIVVIPGSRRIIGNDDMIRFEARSSSNDGAKEQEVIEYKFLKLAQSREQLEDQKAEALQKWHLIEKVGSGGYGSVYKAQRKQGDSKEIFACKVIDLRDLKVVKNDNEIHLELTGDTLLRLDHPNVVKFIEHYSDERKVWLIQEFVDGANLRELVDDGKLQAENDIKSIARQLASALQYIHRMGIVHRDLKAENVMLTSKDNTVKLVDFGKATADGRASAKRTLGIAKQDHETFYICGTPHYAAPESLQGNATPLTAAIDVWALGIITYLLCSGEMPFPHRPDGSVYEAERDAVRTSPDFGKIRRRFHSNEAIDFVRGLLIKDPDQRPSVDHVLHHPWLNNGRCSVEDLAKTKEVANKIQSQIQSTLSLSQINLTWQEQETEDQDQIFSQHDIIHAMQRGGEEDQFPRRKLLGPTGRSQFDEQRPWGYLLAEESIQGDVRPSVLALTGDREYIVGRGQKPPSAGQMSYGTPPSSHPNSAFHSPPPSRNTMPRSESRPTSPTSPISPIHHELSPPTTRSSNSSPWSNPPSAALQKQSWDNSSTKSFGYDPLSFSLRSGDVDTPQEAPLSFPMMGSAEDLIMQLLVSEAVIDARDFVVLTVDEVEELKRENASIIQKVESLSSRLQLESKMREAAQSLTRLHASNKRLSKQANEQLANANKKVDQVAADLWHVTQRGSDVQRKLLQHTAAVLSVGVKSLEDQLDAAQEASSRATSSQRASETDAQSDRLNAKIARLHAEVNESRATIQERDQEIERLKAQLADNAAHNIAATTEARDREISDLKSELEQVTTRLDMTLRKQQEGRRQSYSDSGYTESRTSDATSRRSKVVVDQLSGTLQAVESQMRDYQNQIARLESELAEARSTKEVSTNAQQDETRARLEHSLKEALLDTERLKTVAERERRKREEMQSLLQEVEEEVKLIDELKQEVAKGRDNAHDVERLRQDVERLQTENASLIQTLDANAEEAAENLKNVTRRHEDVMDLLQRAAVNVPDVTSPKMSNRTSFSLPQFVANVASMADENQRLVQRVIDLQTQLGEFSSKEAAYVRRVSALNTELQSTNKALAEIQKRAADLEMKHHVSESETKSRQTNEHALLDEISSIREELGVALQEKSRLQQLLNRQTVMEVLQDGNKNWRKDYEQRIEDMHRDHLAEMEEQQSHLQKLKRELDVLRIDRQESQDSVKQLEEVLKEKMERLDSQAIALDRLQNELHESYRKQGETERMSQSAPAQVDESIERELSHLRTVRETLEAELALTQDQLKAEHHQFLTAQEAFSRRELAMEREMEVLQNELDGILKEFEKLTTNFTDFEGERSRYQGQIDTLRERTQVLETQLADEKIKTMGLTTAGESATTATLRREFRKLMGDLRTEQQKVLSREVEEKKKIEMLNREMRRERDMARWEKINKGTQTSFAMNLAKVLSPVDDKKTIDALELLSKYYEDNNSDSRRRLRGHVEKTSIENNKAILLALSKVHDNVVQVEQEVAAMQACCETMTQQLQPIQEETGKIMERADAFRLRESTLSTKVELAKAFLDRFTLSEGDTDILSSSSLVVDSQFFQALGRLQQVQSSCEVLLTTEVQTAGLDILESLSRVQDVAFNKLHRWTLYECRSFSQDSVEISRDLGLAMNCLKLRPVLFQSCVDEVVQIRRSAVVRSFIDALTRGGPGGVPRPIELHAHDPLRYVGDMLAWIHQCVASERELFEGVLGIALTNTGSPRRKNSMDVMQQVALQSQEENDQTLKGILDRILHGCCRPLKARVEQVLLSQLGSVLCFKLANLLQYYTSTIKNVLDEQSALMHTLQDITDSAFSMFMDSINNQSARLLRETQAKPMDVMPPLQFRQIIEQLKEILDVYETNLLMSKAQSSPGAKTQKYLNFNDVLTAIIDPLLQVCRNTKGQLRGWDANIYWINCLSLIQTALKVSANTDSANQYVLQQIHESVEELIEEDLSVLLKQSALESILQGWTTSQSKKVPMATLPGMDARSISQKLTQFDEFLVGANVNIPHALSRLSSTRLARDIQTKALKRLVKEYTTIHNAVEDPQNGYDFPATILNHTAEEVEMALGLLNGAYTGSSTHIPGGKSDGTWLDDSAVSLAQPQAHHGVDEYEQNCSPDDSKMEEELLRQAVEKAAERSELADEDYEESHEQEDEDDDGDDASESASGSDLDSVARKQAAVDDVDNVQDDSIQPRKHLRKRRRIDAESDAQHSDQDGIAPNQRHLSQESDDEGRDYQALSMSQSLSSLSSVSSELSDLEESLHSNTSPSPQPAHTYGDNIIPLKTPNPNFTTSLSAEKPETFPTIIDPNAKDRSGRPRLFTLASKGDLETFKLYVAAGADVHALDSNGRSPLHEAAFYGQKEIVRYLLERGGDPTPRSRVGDTPLHEACSKSQTACVNLLVEHGANIFAVNNRRRRPYDVCTNSKCRKALGPRAPLASNIDQKDKAGQTALHRSSGQGDLEEVKELIEMGADVNVQDNACWAPLHEASLNGHADVVEYLLQHGADVNIRGYDDDTPLHDACQNEHVAVVRKLLIYGADHNLVNSQGEIAADVSDNVTILNLLRKADDPAVAERWRRKRTDTASAASTENRRESEALKLNHAREDSHDSVAGNPTESGEKHLSREERKLQQYMRTFQRLEQRQQKKAVSHTLGGRHRTPSRSKSSPSPAPESRAKEDQEEDEQKDSKSRNKGLDSVRLNPKRKDKTGRTDLHKYSAKGNLEFVRRLLDDGADVNITDNAGWTPLHEAVLKGHTNIVSLLLSRGADVNAKGLGGESPLHDACEEGMVEIVKALLQHGADVDTRNSDARTALDLALEAENDNVVRLLKSHNAQDKDDEQKRQTPSGRRKINQWRNSPASDSDTRKDGAKKRRLVSGNDVERKVEMKQEKPAAAKMANSGVVKLENQDFLPSDLDIFQVSLKGDARKKTSPKRPKEQTKSVPQGISVKMERDDTFDVSMARNMPSRTNEAPFRSGPTLSEAMRYLPLYTLQLLEQNGPRSFFVVDLQVRLLLGLTSAEFSKRYGHIYRRLIIDHEKERLWSPLASMVSRRCVAAVEICTKASEEADEEVRKDVTLYGTSEAINRLKQREKRKFLDLELYFIKLDDVISIIQQEYEYLSNNLITITLDIGYSKDHEPLDLPSPFNQRSPSPHLAPISHLYKSQSPPVQNRPRGLPPKFALKLQKGAKCITPKT
ncbi:hypothetical protein BZG36_01438 [Bifiguratus adelaidae]|uniref:Conserved oligomeric Golgi complex subunit 6 n=1 Tax=Bifiguratus adelaidae TaxID=1938954 RepID=A0A261Y539_9FUNG|nr:hypothetical protein BZG36_01438 [Bifiguratus adelaidae]